MIKSPPTLTFSEALKKYPRLAQSLGTEEFVAYLREMDERYLHWDEMRFHQPPSGVPVEAAWTWLRFQRNFNAKQAPFADKLENPFTFWWPDPLLRLLNQIDRKAGHLIGGENAERMPSREHYVISSLMDEAISSSQLEGAATTRHVAKEMLRTGRTPRDRNERMIWNNWRTIAHVRETRQKELTLPLILAIHTLITEGTLDDPRDAGRVRTTDDIVIVDHRTEEVVHTPPSHTVLEDRLKQLCDFANAKTDEGAWIHPIAKAAMLHFWLAYDHPFVDGNGRTARALFYWYLLSREYWLFEYLSISRYFLQAPMKYAKAFQKTETDNGDLNYFLHFNLQTIAKALEDLHTFIKHKQDEFLATARSAQQLRNINPRQQAIMTHALRTPDGRYTIAEHQTTNGIAYGTARSDLMELASRGFLLQHTEGKTFVFLVPQDLQERLREDEPTSPRHHKRRKSQSSINIFDTDR